MTLNKDIYGDFQTPKNFCDQVIKLLHSKYGITPKLALEPTLGKGNFLKAAVEVFNLEKLFGVDINREYIEECSDFFCEHNINFVCDSAFDFPYSRFIEDTKNELLVIGNPPWVTNSDLSSDETTNLPSKTNSLKKNTGFSAISGASNFDIAEYILIHVFNEFKDRSNTTFAFLIKNIVARNLLKESKKTGLNFSLFDVFDFDAHEVFGVSCDACLLVCRLSDSAKVEYASVYSMSNPNVRLKRYGYHENVFVSNIDDYLTGNEISGISQIQWRQGIKHDCSKVMELTMIQDCLVNKLGEDCTYLLGNNRLFPLVKSSEIKGGKRNGEFKHFVIVTQDKVGQDTSFLKKDIRLWSYLESHNDYFNARKSSIYKKAYPYSIFGVGDYSFTKYKIALSGFYKKPSFTFLSSEKPVMTDDTCYFVGLDNYALACVLFCAVDSLDCYKYISSVAFSDSKRPFTKDVLQTIDFYKLISKVGFKVISKRLAEEFNLSISEEEYHSLKNGLLSTK